MRYLSVCSGIEAATQAWHPLGWKPVAFSQFDPDHKGNGPDFASAVLAHHYPDVPNLGDMTKYRDWPDANVDVLVGGTPCQSFSVAGLRAGLDDERGNLMLVYAAIARKYRPRWLAWENVPGVLSDDGGRSFASLLGLLSGRRVEVPRGGWETAGVVPGISGAYGLAWRVLDAQFVRVDGFGRAVPQRRRRVFVVGYSGGDWRRAAAVLFERSSLSGDPPPRRTKGQGVAGAVVSSSARRGGVSEGERGGLIPEVSRPVYAGGSRSGGGRRPGGSADDCDGLIPEIAPTLSESSGHARLGDNVQSVGYLIPEVANPLTARMHKGVNTTMDEGQTMIGEPMVFDETQITNPNNRSPAIAGAPSHPLAAQARPPAIAFDCKAGGKNVGLAIGEEVAGALHGEGHGGGRAAVMAWQNRFRGDDGRGYTRAPTMMEEVAGTLDTVKPWNIASSWVVRRLMPIECERLQGFPDNFTSIPTWNGWRKMEADETPEECMAAGLEVRQNKKTGKWRVKDVDGPRYKALGNSMAVNVMRWLGRRIEMVEDICKNNIDIDPTASRIST